MPGVGDGYMLKVGKIIIERTHDPDVIRDIRGLPIWARREKPLWRDGPTDGESLFQSLMTKT